MPSIFQGPGYEDGSREEKMSLEDAALHDANKRIRRRSKLLTVWGSLLLVGLFLLALALGDIRQRCFGIPSRPGNIGQDLPDEKSFLKHATRAVGDRYLLGVGKADITGPVVEVNFMGYAEGAQIGTGLRQRLYSRAFIVAGDTNNPSDRFVYLVLDISSGDTAIRYGILEGVAKLGPAFSGYSKNNIAVTGTHSHSGPGGFNNYLLPQVTNLGFSKESYQAIVDGAVLSIKRAHESLSVGRLAFAETTIPDAAINRSPYSYLANPAEERAKYADNIDKTLTMLRFQRESDGLNTGILAWHSVHPTSMLANNTHVSGDNKGLASYLFEKAMIDDKSAAPGFVAAFSQGSVGDTTPNVLGAWCDDGSGQQCSFEQSTCNGNAAVCHGRGPLFHKLDLGVSSCFEIGRRVYAGAKALYDTFDSEAVGVTGSSVKAYHTFNDMRFFKFPLPNGTIVQSCPAALGYAFAAGTSDWPGPLDFTQSNNDSNSQNPLWRVASGIVKTPSPEQKACQSPKPILLDVGNLEFPYPWAPNIVDVQSLRVGQFFITISPSEVSSMAGRRWKEAVAKAAITILPAGTTPKVVLGGPGNTYAHYVTTREEYGIQRYEGGSTLYGPYHLDAFIYLSTSNIGYLKSDATPQIGPGPSPPNNSNRSLNFISPVVHDQPPVGRRFGQVITQPQASYTIGSVVKASFTGANPRNNFRLEGTFAAVEQRQPDGTWKQVRDDFDWALVYTWIREDGFWGTSRVEIDWETETWTQKGTYRIRYYGDSKTPFTGRIVAFTGTSNEFSIV